MILANLTFCGDSLQLLHATSWHYNLQCESDVKIQARAWATKVENIRWIKHRPQGADLRTEKEKQHLKPQQRRTTGKAASLFPLGYKASRQFPCWHCVPHSAEGLCLCRINSPVRRSNLSDATEVDITHFIPSWSYTFGLALTPKRQQSFLGVTVTPPC